MDNISLISINSDSNKLSIEVEAIDYQEIENLVRLMANSGVDISIGSSRRSNNLLIGSWMLEIFKNMFDIKLTRLHQIILFGTFLFVSFYFLISIIFTLNNSILDIKKENEITISRIEFLSSIKDQEIISRSNFSSNFASSLNTSALDKNLKIDRSLPLSDGEISIWINESNFVDLFNWLLEINNNNVEITKMNIRRVSGDSVSAQLTFKS